MAEAGNIERRLASADEEQRLQGLRELREAGGAPPLNLLFGALGDPSWRVRKEAVELFLALPAAARLSGEIAELLHAEENAGLRNAAVEILVRIGKPAVPTLLEEVSCADQDVRKFALDILGEIGDATALPTIVEALQDPDRNVRSAAAENLGKIGSPVAVPALLAAMEEPDLWMRFTILEAISQIGAGTAEAPASQLLRYREDPLLRKALYDCLGQLGNGDAVEALLEGLGDAMRNVREAAALALYQIDRAGGSGTREALAGLRGNPAVGGVAEMLRADDARLVQAAVCLLGRIGDSRYGRDLLEIMEQEEYRQEAAAALVEMGTETVEALAGLWEEAAPLRKVCLAHLIGATAWAVGVPLLRQGLREDYPLLRMVSARSLGDVGGAAELELLLAALEDQEEVVGQAALEGITAIGRRLPGQVRKLLRPLLEGGESEVRMTAVTVLGRLGGPGIGREMVFALKDESPLVRQAAIKALEEAGPAEALEPLMLALTDEAGEVRRMAAEALGMSGRPEALQALCLALEDEDFWVRGAAVRALGGLGTTESWDSLVGALDDPVGLVGIAALETLAALDPERAHPHLVKALERSDEEVVHAALEILARGGQRDWLAGSVERLLDHPHWEVRAAFSRVLAELDGPASRPHLERRLLVEGEELVRQQIRELLSMLTGE